MGHYDDCYEYQEEQTRKRRDAGNKRAMTNVKKALSKLEDTISELYIDDYEEMVEQKITELRALIYYAAQGEE